MRSNVENKRREVGIFEGSMMILCMEGDVAGVAPK